MNPDTGLPTIVTPNTLRLAFEYIWPKVRDEGNRSQLTTPLQEAAIRVHAIFNGHIRMAAIDAEEEAEGNSDPRIQEIASIISEADAEQRADFGSYTIRDGKAVRESITPVQARKLIRSRHGDNWMEEYRAARAGRSTGGTDGTRTLRIINDNR